jgi:phosphoglycolate phosphatase
MLADLRTRGFALYVCTSKVEHFAIRILDLFELSEFFTGLYGDKAEYADHSKPLLLARLLGERGLSRDNSYMIGDRIFDFEAARVNSVRSIAAGWGYGTPEECAQAFAIAPTPANVFSIVATHVLAKASDILSA